MKKLTALYMELGNLAADYKKLKMKFGELEKGSYETVDGLLDRIDTLELLNKHQEITIKYLEAKLEELKEGDI